MYHFAWENMDAVSDVTVSSVHTSDLSSYDITDASDSEHSEEKHLEDPEATTAPSEGSEGEQDQMINTIEEQQEKCMYNTTRRQVMVIKFELYFNGEHGFLFLKIHISISVDILF